MNPNDSKNHVDSPQVRLHIIKLSFIATSTQKKLMRNTAIIWFIFNFKYNNMFFYCCNELKQLFLTFGKILEFSVLLFYLDSNAWKAKNERLIIDGLSKHNYFCSFHNHELPAQLLPNRYLFSKIKSKKTFLRKLFWC